MHILVQLAETRYKLLELLVPALKMMASEATFLGLEVNWQKTKVQAVGSREDEP